MWPVIGRTFKGNPGFSPCALLLSSTLSCDLKPPWSPRHSAPSPQLIGSSGSPRVLLSVPQTENTFTAVIIVRQLLDSLHLFLIFQGLLSFVDQYPVTGKQLLHLICYLYVCEKQLFYIICYLYMCAEVSLSSIIFIMPRSFCLNTFIWKLR